MKACPLNAAILATALTLIPASVMAAPRVAGGSPSAPSPDDALIVLQVRTSNTDRTVHEPPDCPEGHHCLQLATWVTYRARVLSVHRGHFAETEVAFAHLQHVSYSDARLRRVRVELVPATDEERSRMGVAWVSRAFTPAD